MNEQNILIKIQELTKELGMLKRSLNYKDELQAAKDEVEELSRKRWTSGRHSTYLVMSKWLLEALLGEGRQLSNYSAFYYDTTVGNLQVVPLDVTERVIMVG